MHLHSSRKEGSPASVGRGGSRAEDDMYVDIEMHFVVIQVGKQGQFAIWQERREDLTGYSNAWVKITTL
jgi:hypothetical protein